MVAGVECDTARGSPDLVGEGERGGDLVLGGVTRSAVLLAIQSAFKREKKTQSAGTCISR